MNSRSAVKRLGRFLLRSTHRRNICTSVRLLDKKDEGDGPGTGHTEEGQVPHQLEIQKYHQNYVPENPILRTGRILKDDMIYLKKRVSNFLGFESGPVSEYFFPAFTDILIIGGGGIGSSVAYWIKEKTRHGTHVTVVEKDTTYCEASTCLSVGGVRQQFSLPESIQMSLFGAEFIRNMKKNLAIDGHPAPDPQFQPYGYLFLASEKGAQTLEENSKLQRELGAKNILLTADRLKAKFPWINTEGVALGCLGLENEGWFDPWSLLLGLKQKSINLGAEYVHGEVIGFDFEEDHNQIVAGEDTNKRFENLNRAIVRMPNGDYRTIKFGICVIAAGANSGEVAKMAKIGLCDGLRSVPLPIEPRKRYVYCFHSPDGPGLNTPLTIDSTGVYFRREGLGGNFIAGCSPEPDEEPSVDNLDVDYQYFDTKIWPVLAQRVPSFQSLKVKNAWAGYYEYNALDANGVVGPHPYYHNLYIAAGFSGHGIQHAPAVGRAIMEMILYGDFQTINLSRLGFDRLSLNEPLRERNIW